MKRWYFSFAVLFVLTQLTRLLPKEWEIPITVAACVFMLIILAGIYRHLSNELDKHETHAHLYERVDFSTGTVVENGVTRKLTPEECKELSKNMEASFAHMNTAFKHMDTAFKTMKGKHK